MFVNECTVCHRNQLIFLSQVTATERTDDGHVMTYTCWCGAEQTVRVSSLLDKELTAA